MERTLKLQLIITCVCVYFNTQGQNTYTGIIAGIVDPCIEIPMKPYYLVSTLATASGTYVLTLNSLPIKIGDSLIVENAKYSLGEIVTITGTTKIKQGSFLEEYYELEIETIESSSLNQDSQRFLGSYSVEMVCNINSTDPTLSNPMSGKITLSEGRQNELVFSTTGYVPVDGKYTFVSEDSLFIPFQWHWYFPSGAMGSFSGKGKIENDSIFFNVVRGTYAYDFSHVHYTTCYCKGKKEGSTVIYGCTDATAVNYNLNAIIDDGSCDYRIVAGCTDATAINYNPNATEDDGSCDYGGTAAKTLQATPLQIFPNPTTGELTITGVEAEQTTQTVEIYDNTGRLVETHSRASLHGNGLTIDISHLPNGVYFIQINGKRVAVVKW